MMVVHLLLARPVARRAVHLQLRHARDQGRADARRRRRLDHGVRQPRLFDADLARSGPAAVARPDRERRRRWRCRAQNVQVASGVLNQPPVDKPGAFQIAVQTLGRLADPEEFGNIVVKQTADRGGAAARTSRAIELAAQDYSSNSYLDRDPAVALAVFQRPGLERARDRATRSVKTMERLSKRFPPGVELRHRLRPDRSSSSSRSTRCRRRSSRRSCWSCWSSSCSCRPGAPRSSRWSRSRSR